MASTMSNVEMLRLVERLKEDSYGAGDDSQRNIENDQIDALKEKVHDLTKLVVELVARIT